MFLSAFNTYSLSIYYGPDPGLGVEPVGQRPVSMNFTWQALVRVKELNKREKETGNKGEGMVYCMVWSVNLLERWHLSREQNIVSHAALWGRRVWEKETQRPRVEDSDYTWETLRKLERDEESGKDHRSGTDGWPVRGPGHTLAFSHSLFPSVWYTHTSMS